MTWEERGGLVAKATARKLGEVGDGRRPRPGDGSLPDERPARRLGRVLSAVTADQTFPESNPYGPAGPPGQPSAERGRAPVASRGRPGRREVSRDGCRWATEEEGSGGARRGVTVVPGPSQVLDQCPPGCGTDFAPPPRGAAAPGSRLSRSPWNLSGGPPLRPLL